MNLRILVCDTCYDEPQQQLRAIVVPADPVPIQNPRTTNYRQAEKNERIVSVNPYNQWVNNSGVVKPWENNANQIDPWTGFYVGTPTTINTNTGIPVPGSGDRITQNTDDRVLQQTGEPPGGLNQLPGTDWAVPEVYYGAFGIGLPYDNTSVPYTGPLSPPYNFVDQWNNIRQFGIRTGSYWANGVGAFVNWTTTTL